METILNKLPPDLSFEQWLIVFLLILMVMGYKGMRQDHQRELDNRQREIDRLMVENDYRRGEFLKVLAYLGIK